MFINVQHKVPVVAFHRTAYIDADYTSLTMPKVPNWYQT